MGVGSWASGVRQCTYIAECQQDVATADDVADRASDKHFAGVARRIHDVDESAVALLGAVLQIVGPVAHLVNPKDGNLDDKGDGGIQETLEGELGRTVKHAGNEVRVRRLVELPVLNHCARALLRQLLARAEPAAVDRAEKHRKDEAHGQRDEEGGHEKLVRHGV